MAESLGKIGYSENSNSFIKTEKIELPDDPIIDNPTETIMVKLEIHQPYSLAPSSSHSDETVAISRLPLIIAESEQKLETRPKEMQNNPDRIEALSVAAEYNMQNDCAIKKEPKFENDPDEKIKSSRVPLIHAERQRKYRAKQKEKHKLQINSDGMVALTPAAEYMRKYRAKKKEQRLLNNPDGKLALSFVPMTNAERQQKYRAKLKQKNELENNSNGMEGSSPAAEYMRNYRAEKKKQQIQNNPQEILKSTRVPLTHAERQRKYRAKQKEKHKLQINSDGREVLSSAAEYMRKYRAKKKEQKLQNNRDKKLDLPSVPLTTAVRVRNYRARQKSKSVSESDNFNSNHFVALNIENFDLNDSDLDDKNFFENSSLESGDSDNDNDDDDDPLRLTPV